MNADAIVGLLVVVVVVLLIGRVTLLLARTPPAAPGPRSPAKARPRPNSGYAGHDAALMDAVALDPVDLGCHGNVPQPALPSRDHDAGDSGWDFDFDPD